MTCQLVYLLNVSPWLSDLRHVCQPLLLFCISKTVRCFQTDTRQLISCCDEVSFGSRYCRGDRASTQLGYERAPNRRRVNECICTVLYRDSQSLWCPGYFISPSPALLYLYVHYFHAHAHMLWASLGWPTLSRWRRCYVACALPMSASTASPWQRITEFIHTVAHGEALRWNVRQRALVYLCLFCIHKQARRITFQSDEPALGGRHGRGDCAATQTACERSAHRHRVFRHSVWFGTNLAKCRRQRDRRAKASRSTPRAASQARGDSRVGGLNAFNVYGEWDATGLYT